MYILVLGSNYDTLLNTKPQCREEFISIAIAHSRPDHCLGEIYFGGHWNMFVFYNNDIDWAPRQPFAMASLTANVAVASIILLVWGMCAIARYFFPSPFPIFGRTEPTLWVCDDCVTQLPNVL